MSGNLYRLRRGESWWLAEISLRTIGLLSLAACYRLGLLTHGWVTNPPPHHTTPREFGACLAIVLCLSTGLALTLFGPKLFEYVPIPKRSALHWKDR